LKVVPGRAMNMTDPTSSSTEVDNPMDCDLEGHVPCPPGLVPSDYVGLEEHGRAPEEPGVTRRTIASFVWGGAQARVNVEHGTTATWDPCLTGKDPKCCPCCWYSYAEVSLCMKGCVHPGMDIGLEKRTSLLAAKGGTVAFAGCNGYFRPYHVDIRTEDGELHIYGHMWKIASGVRTGASVQEGQFLGMSGEQTRKGTCIPDGTGAHLHFERRERRDENKWCAVDPGPVLIAYCRPDPPPPFDGTVKTVNNIVFHPDQRTVQCVTDGLGCRRWANRRACNTRKPLTKGETIEVDYWVQGEEVQDEDRWWVARSGFRFWSGGTNRKPA
jgi:hypothetical protein